MQVYNNKSVYTRNIQYDFWYTNYRKIDFIRECKRMKKKNSIFLKKIV